MQASFDEFRVEFIAHIKEQKLMGLDYTKFEKLMMKLVLEIQEITDNDSTFFLKPNLIKRLNQLQSILIVINICNKVDTFVNSNPLDQIYIIDMYPYLSDDVYYKFKCINKTQVVHYVMPLLRKELKELKYNTFVSNDPFLQMKLLCSKDAFSQTDLSNKISCMDIIQNKKVTYFF